MEILESLKDSGEIEAMTGDGVYDAPALKPLPAGSDEPDHYRQKQWFSG